MSGLFELRFGCASTRPLCHKNGGLVGLVPCYPSIASLELATVLAMYRCVTAFIANRQPLQNVFRLHIYSFRD
jgi:hypothetical protein